MADFDLTKPTAAAASSAGSTVAQSRQRARNDGKAPTTPGDGPRHSMSFDIAVGLLAGLAATQVTNLAQGPLKWLTPDGVQRHEKLVRPGASSSLVAARKLAQQVGASPTRQEEAWSGKAIHFAIGVGWGPVYGLLRRYLGLRPFGAALGSGVAMSLLLDEGLVPALGLSAPNHHYPALTRIRGLVAHLVYGAAAALATEGLCRVTGRSQRDAGRTGRTPNPS